MGGWVGCGMGRNITPPKPPDGAKVVQMSSPGLVSAMVLEAFFFWKVHPHTDGAKVVQMSSPGLVFAMVSEAVFLRKMEGQNQCLLMLDLTN